MRKEVVVALLFIVPISMYALPVMANITDPGPSYYVPSSIQEIDGVWDSTSHDAIETQSGFSYRCEIIFYYTMVDTSADVYKIDIDYDGEEPGWFWQIESLEMLYRWGSGGSWTHLAYFDVSTYDGKMTITDATSSTLQIRIIGCIEFNDNIQHTWYFGAEPQLWLYWT